MKKKKIKKSILVLIILIIGFSLFVATLSYQRFYTSHQLLRENVVYLSGPSATDLGYVMPKVEKKGLYGFGQISYEIANKNNITAYNVILLDKLAPVTEYQLKIKFNAISNSQKVSSFDVGAINYPPQGAYDANTKTYITNITTNIYDKYKFSNLMVIDGFYKYQTEVVVNTNENGQAWLVIGANALNDAPLTYSFGQVKIQTTELKNVHPIDTKSADSTVE